MRPPSRIYSVGCLQIPFVDLVATTVCNVMMVGMTTAIHDGRETQVMDLWHDTVRKLAIVFFPLGALLLVVARDLIVMLFTDTYAASVPIFMVGAAAVFFAAIPMDGLLRVYARTNVLLMINVVRLVMIALLIHWAIRSLGLVGAMLVTVLALAVGKAIGVAAAGSLWRVGVGRLLPWRALSLIALVSLAASLPALAVGIRTADGALPPDPCDRHRLRICVCGDGSGLRSRLAPMNGPRCPSDGTPPVHASSPVSTQAFLRCDVCGIAGIVSHEDQTVDVEELQAMCAALVSRGPDDEGTYVKDGAGLAMRRLSIIDLETGHQPVSNEDGSIWVVLNGEIYNYRQLRSDLERRGHRFATATDTEVIVHLYEEHGTIASRRSAACSRLPSGTARDAG